MKIYVLLDGKRNGPYELEDVKALLEAGTLRKENLAWKSGLSEWKPLKDLFPEWMEDSTLPPPDPASPTIAPPEPSTTPEKSDPAEDSMEEKDAQAVDPEEEGTAPPDQASTESVKPTTQTTNPPPDNMYLSIGGEQHGPLSPEQTMALFLSGKAGENDLAWKDGMEAWVTLKEIWPDCAKEKPASKPVSQASSTNLSERLRNALREK
tara:strand:- start:14370 stop:14993 length:624 start_codon:yes stop_codon:yes gene_type:complete